MIRNLALGAAASLAFASMPVRAQEAPQDLINSAAEAHALFQRKGGLDGVKRGITECWENAAKQASFKAAVYCSAYNFTAANFDRQAMAMFKAKSTLSMSEANRRSKAALLRAGVPPERVPALMDDIRDRVTAATNRQF